MFNKSKTPMTQKITGAQTSGPKPGGGTQAPIMPSGLAGASTTKPAGGIAWENPYKGDPYHYKGQIHCHSQQKHAPEGGVGGIFGVAGVVADLVTPEIPLPNWTPELVLDSYTKKGYKFVCLTDHNRVTRMPQNVKQPAIFIDSVEDGATNSHHIEVLGVNYEAARTAEADYFDRDHDGVCNFLTNDCSNIPGRIYYYSAVQKAVTVLGHPHSPHGSGITNFAQGYTFNELLDNFQAQYRGRPYSYTGIEIYNSSNSDDLRVAWCLDWWDELLVRGKRVWGFAGDDCHGYSSDNKRSLNKKSFNRSWIVVNSSKDPASVRQNDILQNIRAGNFITVVRSPDVAGESIGDGSEYAGPSFDVSLSGTRITVTTGANCSHILAISGPAAVNKYRLVTAADGKKSVSFEPSAESIYVRIVLETTFMGELYRAFSQPLFNKSLIKTK